VLPANEEAILHVQLLAIVVLALLVWSWLLLLMLNAV